MKRKSEQIVPDINRLLKKNKTQFHHRKSNLKIDINNHTWSQIIVSKIIDQLEEDVLTKIKMVAHNELLDSIVSSCYVMAQNLSCLVCPQLHQKQCPVVIDQQPKRVAYDPICGFDKLVTIRNDIVNKNEQNSLSQTKSKQFSIFQNYKKQKNQKSNYSCANRLIPLQSLSLKLNPTKSQKQNDKQQTFYRDRLFQNGLPMITTAENKKSQPKKQPNKLGLELLKQNPCENYVFDYNGQKYTLSTNISNKSNNQGTMKQPNNVLKTTYRVLQTINQDRKKGSVSKNKPNRISSNYLDSFVHGKQIIKNPNLKFQTNTQTYQSCFFKTAYSMDQDQIMKSLLQTNFKEKQVVFRPKQKTNRNSKLL